MPNKYSKNNFNKNLFKLSELKKNTVVVKMPTNVLLKLLNSMEKS